MRLASKRRLLTIGHSYSVAANRRLAQALAVRGDWDVTVAAPKRFRGDFRTHELHGEPGEAYALEALPARMTRPVHVMLYGRRLRDLLQQPWDLVHCWEEPYVAAAAQVTAGRLPTCRSSSQRSRTFRSGTRLRSAGSSAARWRAPTA